MNPFSDDSSSRSLALETIKQCKSLADEERKRAFAAEVKETRYHKPLAQYSGLDGRAIKIALECLKAGIAPSADQRIAKLKALVSEGSAGQTETTC